MMHPYTLRREMKISLAGPGVGISVGVLLPPRDHWYTWPLVVSPRMEVPPINAFLNFMPTGDSRVGFMLVPVMPNGLPPA